MKPILSGTAILLACSALTLTAQQRNEVKQEPAHKVFVMSGCLESSEAGAPFKLTRAAVVGQGAAPPSQDAYELQPIVNFTEQGLKREELQSHVGRQVEVTIRPVEVTTPAPPLPADSKVRPQEVPSPRYTVSKIGRLAESCSR
jgi:hypothetical protein